MSGTTPARSGAYNLSGGQVTSTAITVGNSGTAASRSRAALSTQTLTLGNLAGGLGTYSLTGNGTLSASQTIGGAGTGIFTQSGGSNSGSVYLGSQRRRRRHLRPQRHRHPVRHEVRRRFGLWQLRPVGRHQHGDLYLGYASGGVGAYSLSGTGQLSATNEYIGYNSAASGHVPAVRRHEHRRTCRSAPSGRYRLSGGTLQISNGGMTNQGVFDGGERLRPAERRQRHHRPLARNPGQHRLHVGEHGQQRPADRSGRLQPGNRLPCHRPDWSTSPEPRSTCRGRPGLRRRRHDQRSGGLPGNDCGRSSGESHQPGQRPGALGQRQCEPGQRGADGQRRRVGHQRRLARRPPTQYVGNGGTGTFTQIRRCQRSYATLRQPLSRLQHGRQRNLQLERRRQPAVGRQPVRRLQRQRQLHPVRRNQQRLAAS